MRFQDDFLRLYTPIGSMYGIFIYIYLENQPNVSKYASQMDPMGLEIEDSKLEKSRSLAVKGGKPCWPHVFS